MALWELENPSNVRLVPYRCRSWRHEGDCRRWKGAQDFARIKGAIDTLSDLRDSWVYSVLTFDQRSWKNVYQAYRGLLKCWAKLRKRVDRSWGKTRYIALVEQHRSGWPHLNLLLGNALLAQNCAVDGWRHVRKSWLEPNAVASGFGMRTWIEPVRSHDAIAGYFVKLMGEVTKTSQVPMAAPRHFRRLRSSRGLLPKPYKNGCWSGQLVKAPVELVVVNGGTDEVRRLRPQDAGVVRSDGSGVAGMGSEPGPDLVSGVSAARTAGELGGAREDDERSDV